MKIGQGKKAQGKKAFDWPQALQKSPQADEDEYILELVSQCAGASFSIVLIESVIGKPDKSAPDLDSKSKYVFVLKRIWNLLNSGKECSKWKLPSQLKASRRAK